MKATVAHSMDWCAVYVDGRKIVDGHSVSPFHLLEALGYKVSTIDVMEDEFGEADFPELPANVQEAPTA
jgi:hypothetical protein